MVEHRPWLTFVAHAVLNLGVFVLAFPLWVAFVASTQSAADFNRIPMALLPGGHFIENYSTVLSQGMASAGAIPVATMMFNSLIMALMIAIGKIAISILSAYAIVYFRFPFRRLIFWLIFITLMLPVEVRILPTYGVVAHLGMLNSYAGLSIPLIASATATFLFRQYFLTVPEELLEAARLDGAGPWRFFRDILFPLSRTNIAALFVILFIYGWKSVPLAAARHHRPVLLHDRHGHPAHGHRCRRDPAMATRHGDRDPRFAAAGRGRRRYAASLHQRLDRDREVRSACFMAEIKLVGVTKAYPNGVVALHKIDLKIADRAFLVVVGPSGCGKSTLLRLIAGLETLTEGRVLIGDRDVSRLEPAQRDIAMVFQNYALYPHMNVYDNMAYGLRNRKVPKAEIDQRVRETARTLGLETMLARRPRQLSGGQRQRVAMGRAIVRSPAAFLFDEPLSNLDAKLRVQMRGEIKRLQRQLGTTGVYVTHDQAEAMTMGDQLVVLREGRVEQIGSPLDVYRRPATAFVGGFIGSPSMNFLDGCVENGGRQLRVADAVNISLPGAGLAM